MRRRRLLAGVILLLVAAASPAWPDNTALAPPTDNVPIDNVPIINSVTEYIGPAPSDNSWVDRTHDYLSRETLDTVQWFDDFFGDRARETVTPAESTIRWRNNFRFGTDKTFTYRTDLRASLRLAQLSRKLRLVFSSETLEDTLGINRDATGTTGVTAGGTIKQSSTELRYEFLKSGRSQADIGTGVRIKLPFVFYTQARYSHVLPLGDNTHIRFFPAVFWRTHDGFGQAASIDLEHRVTSSTILRWGNGETTTQKTNGMEWTSEPGILHLLGKDRAATFAVGVSGATRPAATVNTRYILARYRQSILRDWLFAEIEPIQSWLRGATAGYHPVTAVTCRFEVYIRGSRD
ncbi:MAG TPA: hypothetical protein VIU29_10125 [Candidatus Deferrimicrobiaceae bacterium]